MKSEQGPRSRSSAIRLLKDDTQTIACADQAIANRDMPEARGMEASLVRANILSWKQPPWNATN